MPKTEMKKDSGHGLFLDFFHDLGNHKLLSPDIFAGGGELCVGSIASSLRRHLRSCGLRRFQFFLETVLQPPEHDGGAYRCPSKAQGHQASDFECSQPRRTIKRCSRHPDLQMTTKMRSVFGGRFNGIRPFLVATRRIHPIHAEASVQIPGSFEASVSQACQAVRLNVFGAKGKRRGKGLRKLIVEIPNLDTGIENSLFLTSQLVAAMEGDDKRAGASILYSADDICEAARSNFASNTVAPLSSKRQRGLTSRLLIFNPKSEDERNLYRLLDDVWRGDVVLLFNPEFSDAFKAEEKDFLDGFDTVYCFQPLEIKVFLQSKNGALFRWQRERGADAKWLMFIEEDNAFKQIAQQASRPTQEELELAIYNATAAESPITKGFDFLRSMGKRK